MHDAFVVDLVQLNEPIRVVQFPRVIIPVEIVPAEVVGKTAAEVFVGLVLSLEVLQGAAADQMLQPLLGPVVVVAVKLLW